MHGQFLYMNCVLASSLRKLRLIMKDLMGLEVGYSVIWLKILDIFMYLPQIDLNSF